jgi:hypothetical protein
VVNPLMNSHKPILVTGSHRSGTTWIGRMLAEAPSLLYIHEPFSVTDAPSRGICDTEFKYWFTYITSENETNFYKPIRNMIHLKYDFAGGLRTYRSKEGLRELRREYLSFLQYRQKRAKALIKDPMAFFSAEWLAERFDMNVVMVIRHPAAFVSSIKKLGWQHPFSHFLEQSALMSAYLSAFEREIRMYASKDHDLIDQGILLWKLIHHTMLKYRELHKNWIFVRHEDISRNPVEAFRKLYNQLDLEFSEKTQKVVESYSASANPSETDASVGSEEILMRNSASNIWNWKSRLTTLEVETIRSKVEAISCAFYSNEAW